MKKIIELINVTKTYHVGTQIINANNQVNFEILEGEFCVIVGPSGAGKTTILNILGGIDVVTDGVMIVDGQRISELNAKKLTNYRRYEVGFVFQFYNLLPQLTALDNVDIASEISKSPLDSKMVLEQVGLRSRMQNFPAQLSGGEQQRVSIARAIAKNPKILLCDEPTGALDIETGKTILQLLYDTCKIYQKTVIVVTHNLSIAEIADRVIHFKNGQVSEITINKAPKKVDDVLWQ